MNNTTKKVVTLAAVAALSVGVPTIAHAQNDIKKIAAYHISYEETLYIIKNGDTLSSVSKKFFGNEMFYGAIAKYNNIDNPDLIYAGQCIKIPSKLDDLLGCNDYSEDNVYVVKKGDTLSGIANAMYAQDDRVIVDKLATYNRLFDPNVIFEGQLLFIPDVKKLEPVVSYDYSDKYGMKKQRKFGCIH